MTPRLGYALVAAVALSGCSRDEPPSEPPLPNPPRPAAIASAPRALSDAGVPSRDAAPPVPSALVGLRERSLQLEPRARASERIAFGKGRFAQLRNDALIVHSIDGQIVTRVPVTAPRAVVELADGNLLAADKEHTYFLEATTAKVEVKPRVTLFLDSVLLADRRTKNQFWVVYPMGPSLYHYDLTKDAGSLLSFADFVDLGPKLHGARVGAALGLKDGSFALVAGQRVWRVFGSGRVDAMTPSEPERPIARLLLARTLGEVWAVRADGVAERLTLAARMQRTGKIALDPPPFDVASSDECLAVVHLEQRAGQPKRFSLRVYDYEGKSLFERALPAPTGFAAGEDWVDQVTRDEGVALSATAPLVAVGGPGRLQVYDLKTGATVLDE